MLVPPTVFHSLCTVKLESSLGNSSFFLLAVTVLHECSSICGFQILRELLATLFDMFEWPSEHVYWETTATGGAYVERAHALGKGNCF